MKYLLYILLVLSSCKSKNQVKTSSKLEVREVVNNTITKEEHDTLNITNIPFGNKYVKDSFPKTIIFSDKKNSKIKDIINTVYELEKVKSKRQFNSEKEISRTESLLRIFSDRNSKIIENIYNLPIKKGFKTAIEKISTKDNPKNKAQTIYCLSLYQNNKLISRNIIGYLYFGDLVEYYMVWHIDNDFVISTRLIEGVEGNEETYVSELDKFTITKNGDLIRYFDEENNNFKDSNEKGKIENHLKEGNWFEIKKFNGYLKEPTYIEAKYKKGLSFGIWKYYNLIADTKKGNKLLMTEEYDTNGNLLKREILKN